MSQEHNHIELSTWNRRRASSNPFTPKSHTASHLADCVCSSSEGLNYSISPLQSRAVASWTEAKLSKHPASEELDDKRIRMYLQVFDDLFFFGSLASKCVVTITFVRPEAKSGANCRYVEYIDTEEGKGCVLKVWNGLREGDEHKRVDMLGLLLHGMCHAYFMVYACEKDGCDKHSGTRHDEAWQRVAKSVERALWKQLGLGLHLVSSSEKGSLAEDCYNRLALA